MTLKLTDPCWCATLIELMKKDIHPTDYREVVIEDVSNGFKFLTRSTAATDESIKWEDGKSYPHVKVHISSSSHPFYTGEEKLVDVEGRVDRFKSRQAAADKRRAALQNKATKAAKKSQNKTDENVTKLGSKPAQSKNKPKSSKPKPADSSKKNQAPAKEAQASPEEKSESKK